MKLFFALSLLATTVGAYEDTCTQFKDIYSSGTELCEVMWDGAFKVVNESTPGYTMWFFDMDNNPNDATTKSIFGDNTTVDQCHLQFLHKKTPSPEGNDMFECHPWKNNACCDSTTVQSVDQINEAYGPGYQWDRCGPMSQACERFFVMEACLYECEPNAGLFRKYSKSQVDETDYNEWELYQMPIQKSFCDSWYTACYNDYFCGKGSYFGCAAYYEDNASKFEQKLQAEEEKNQGLIIGLSIAGALALVGFVFACFLIHREKTGKPVFYEPPEKEEVVVA